jgi:hypothetical protein
MKREEIDEILKEHRWDIENNSDNDPILSEEGISDIADEILALQDYKPTDEEIKATAHHIVVLSKGALHSSSEETIILGAKLLRDHPEQFKIK